MTAGWPAALRTLAFLFARAPSAEHLNRLRDSRELASILGRDPWEADAEQSAQELADTLADEYTRLFVGPYRHFPPQEGLARGDGELLGEHALTVRDAYERARYSAEPEVGLPFDHLAVELDFAASLLDDGDVPAAASFVQEHLLAWVPAWVEAFAGQARHPFYPALGRALCDCLHELATVAARERAAR